MWQAGNIVHHNSMSIVRSGEILGLYVVSLQRSPHLLRAIVMPLLSCADLGILFPSTSPGSHQSDYEQPEVI